MQQERERAGLKLPEWRVVTHVGSGEIEGKKVGRTYTDLNVTQGMVHANYEHL